jgi:hypothetical protein
VQKRARMPHRPAAPDLRAGVQGRPKRFATI